MSLTESRRLELGIDIGGTFTDLVLCDASGPIVSFKTPTRPHDPAAGVSDAITGLADHGVHASEISYFVHGATIGVNSIIQRSGARTALLATEGFRDVLELGRLRLPVPYSFHSRRPDPLVPRERVVTVRERTRNDGTIETALEEGEIGRVLDAVDDLDVESVAVCLLHSYAQPAHERLLAQALRRRRPDLFVTCSSEIWPAIREYERALVTVMNAYVGPPIASYLERLVHALDAHGVAVRPYLTRSNGGIMTAEVAREEAVHLLLSGPASGVIGAARVGGQAGFADLITFDMGGTSADIAIVEAGRVAYSTSEHVGDFPVTIPAVAISSIGAGGGSIAAVDAAGVLKVGPASAGAEPGPACYGLGGEQATVTDAFLACGYLDPHAFAGKTALDVAAAERALADIGAKLGRSVPETADGILQVALANMYGEVAAILERRGIDPREFAILAFGGAGPVVACMLADELGVATVVFPPAPGTLCAFGALTADAISDFIHTVNWRSADAARNAFISTMKQLRWQAEEWLGRQAPPGAIRDIQMSADLRYIGQSYEIEIGLPEPLPGPEELWDVLVKEFNAAHDKLFGQSDSTAPIEVTNVRARAIGRMPVRGTALVTSAPSMTTAVERVIRLGGNPVTAAIIDRAGLAPDDCLHGPLILRQADTTVVLPIGWSARLDPLGNLLARRGDDA